MDPRTAATRVPDPDAVEFIRYCYRRRRVGWPELYDEMCAVASRGLFRGYGTDELGDIGIGFALFDMPALAGLANQVIAEEKALRRPMTVIIAEAEAETAAAAIESPTTAIEAPAPRPAPVPVMASAPSMDRPAERETTRPFHPSVVPAGA